MTPQLGIFADIAMATANSNNAPATMNILALAKAAGYQLDNIASTVDGRFFLRLESLLLKNGNIALGLRLLTAASEAEGLRTRSWRCPWRRHCRPSNEHPRSFTKGRSTGLLKHGGSWGLL
jgi:hypothetical protein